MGKCKGLPFALKAMGSVFLNNQLLDRRRWRNISQLGLCEVERVCRSFEIKPNILPMLKVSYNHLPSCIKPLFSYFSLFPKGYLINKKELSQFWIAESLIQSQAGQQQETMEETASQHFDHLLTRSFFHKRTSRSFFHRRTSRSFHTSSSTDDDQDDHHYHKNDNSDHYMMHDLYHELARSISTPYCWQVEVEDKDVIYQYHFSDKTRHISITCKDKDVRRSVFHVEKIVLEIIEKCKKVRTLLFPFPYHDNLRKVEFGQSLDQLFNSMKYMRVLDLSSSTIRELPKSVKRLKLLRYLNLSMTKIKTLPDSICKLFYLQTLKLLKCPSFSELPRNLANLINLRHLELDEALWFKSDFKLPPRIGSLTNLQTLSRFPIRRDQVGHGIEELKGMSYLTGSLLISNLENAVNAEEAKLDKKEMLDKLVLEWSSNNIGADAVITEEKVLEDLMPHSDLKELQILHFGGSKFPHWMTDHGQLIQLQNLVTVSLEYCTRCTTLSLGGLLHLKKLYVKEMHELKELIYDQELENHVISLALLEISKCPRLTMLPSCFPNLEDLKIKGCDSLKALPVTPVLKVLVLVDNLVLEDLNKEHDYFSSRLELKISGCPKVEIGEERRRAQQGLNRPKIKHVPHREIEIESEINTDSDSDSDPVSSSLHLSNQVLQGHSKASSSTPPGHRLTMPPQKG